MTKDVVAKTESAVQAVLIVRPAQTARAASTVILVAAVGFATNQPNPKLLPGKQSPLIQVNVRPSLKKAHDVQESAALEGTAGSTVDKQ
jgi:hypothetical protein